MLWLFEFNFSPFAPAPPPPASTEHMTMQKLLHFRAIIACSQRGIEGSFSELVGSFGVCSILQQHLHCF
jgi:hypothetical protein